MSKEKSSSKTKRSKSLVKIIFEEDDFKIQKLDVIKLLMQIHPNHKLYNKTIDYLIELISKYISVFDLGENFENKNKVSDEIEKLPGELKYNAKQELKANLERKNLVLPNRYNTIEYLLVELLDVSGDITRANKRTMISEKDVINAIQNDPELQELFKL